MKRRKSKKEKEHGGEKRRRRREKVRLTLGSTKKSTIRPSASVSTAPRSPVPPGPEGSADFPRLLFLPLSGAATEGASGAGRGTRNATAWGPCGPTSASNSAANAARSGSSTSMQAPTRPQAATATSGLTLGTWSGSPRGISPAKNRGLRQALCGTTDHGCGQARACSSTHMHVRTLMCSACTVRKAEEVRD